MLSIIWIIFFVWKENVKGHGKAELLYFDPDVRHIGCHMIDDV